MISSLSFHCTVVYIWGYHLLGVWNGLVIKFNIYPPVIWSSKVFFCLLTAIFEKKFLKTWDGFYYYYILIINEMFFFQTDTKCTRWIFNLPVSGQTKLTTWLYTTGIMKKRNMNLRVVILGLIAGNKTLIGREFII